MKLISTELNGKTGSAATHDELLDLFVMDVFDSDLFTAKVEH